MLVMVYNKLFYRHNYRIYRLSTSLYRIFALRKQQQSSQLKYKVVL